MEINEEIKQKMIEYLQSFEAGIKKAGEFSAEQAPLVVQEFLRWELISNALFGITTGVLFVIFLIVALRYHFKTEGEFKIFVWLFAAIPLVFSFVGSAAGFEASGKAYFAPRIVVLEKIATLVK